MKKLKDNMGNLLKVGQKIKIDSGHAYTDGWDAEVIKVNNKLVLKYKDNDEVIINEILCQYIEIQK